MAKERTLKVVIAGDSDKLDKELRKSHKSLAGLGRQSSVTSRVVAGGMTSMGTAAVAGLGYAVKAAMGFEKQMSALGAVSDASSAQMEAFRKQAMKAGRDTAFSAKEAAVAQTELAKGGLSVANIMKGGLNSALALAAAGEMELGEAAATTANAMNLFGLRGNQSIKVADALATAANATTADVTDFAMALKQGGAVAKSVGFSFEETVVALEALAASGVKNSDAGTSLKTALIQLVRPSNEQAKMAEALGLKWLDAAGNMKSLGDISAMLRGRLGDQTKAQRTATLATLAGTDGVRTLTALYDAGPAKLAKWEQGVHKTGTAAEVARKKQDNLAGAIEQLKGSAETLAITVGTALLPSLTKGTRQVTKFVNEIQDGTGQGGRFANTLKEIWTAVRPIIVGMSRAARAVANFTAEHPGLAKLAASILAIGVAVRTLRFVSAVTGFGTLLKGGRVAAAGLRRIFAGAGTAAGEAAATRAAAGWRGKVAGFARLGKAAGLALGRGIAMGLVLAIPLIAVELTKLTAPIRRLGEKLGKGTANLLGIGRQTGGIVPGTGRGDIVPAMLEPGEFIVRKQVVDKFGPTFFADLNGGMGVSQGNRQVPGYTSGGIISRANRMDAMNLPYKWGGGHGGGIAGGVDCSGAVSYALGVSPRTSGGFMSFGRPGPGSPNDTKIYANREHVFAVFNGRGWGTSRENPGGGPGWLSYNHRPGFTRRHLADSGKGGTSGPSKGDIQEAAEKRKEQRIAREERSGSRLINRLASVGLRGASGLAKAAGSLGAGIEAADTRYGQTERLFGQVIGGRPGAYGEEDLGTAAGRKARITELVALKKAKAAKLQQMKKRATALRGIIGRYRKTLKSMEKARDKAKGHKRTKMTERIRAFHDKLVDYEAEALSLGEAIGSTQLDIGDLQKDIQETALTPDTAPEPGPTVSDQASNLLDLVGLRERAGLMTPEAANAQRAEIIRAAIQGKFGATTEREQLQLLGDLRELEQAQTEAVVDNTSALKELKDSIDAQLAFANGVAAVTSMEAVRALGDVISGQLGTRTGRRGYMPGSGALARL